MDLVTVAAELYALLPSDFVAARNQRAKTAGQSGDKKLARQIRRLPKPSASAWPVNLLVARQPEALEPLLELGVSMRQAQQDLDQQRLKRLGLERSRLTASIQRECRKLAEELGHPVSDSAGAELEQTLRAAIADAAAADAVVSGRLTRSVESTGWEPVDLTDAVAAPETAQRFPAPAGQAMKRSPSAESGRRKPSAGKKRQGEVQPEAAAAEAAEAERERDAEKHAAEAARRKWRAKAESELEDAERRAARAEKELEGAKTSLSDAQLRRKKVTAEIAELQTRLSALERKGAQAVREVETLARECAAAGRSAAVARRDAGRARARVDSPS